VRDAPQPNLARRVDATLALNCFDDERGGRINATRRIVEVALDDVGRVDLRSEIPVEGHKGGTLQWQPGRSAEIPVASCGEGAEAAAVISVGEAQDRLPPGDFPSQLQGSLDRVGSSRAAELELVLKTSRMEHSRVEQLDELTLRGRGQVEPMHDTVRLEITYNHLSDRGIVVLVVQRPRAGKEVDEFATVLRPDDGAVAKRNNDGEGS